MPRSLLDLMGTDAVTQAFDEIRVKKTSKKPVKPHGDLTFYYPDLIECIHTYKSAYKKYLHQGKVERMFARLDRALAILEDEVRSK